VQILCKGAFRRFPRSPPASAPAPNRALSHRRPQSTRAPAAPCPRSCCTNSPYTAPPQGNCKFGPKCANIHILPDGRRINYGKNGNLTIAPSPVALGVGLSPNVKGLSDLKAPLPTSFDSNGIFHAPRYRPWPSSVPSKFGLKSPSSSLSAAKEARTSENLKPLYDSALGYQPPSTPKVGGIGGFRSSPPVNLTPYTGLDGEELLGRKAIQNSSFRYSKPRAIYSSVPKLDRDWDAEFLFEEDYVPGALANEVLTAAEKARRGSTNTVDFTFPQGEEHGGLLTETKSERDSPSPTLIPAKDPSSATAATEKATTSHVCPHCQREFPRFHDLVKHSKSHNRPFKCSFSTCKYYDRGWPTAKELERHVNDKHSALPRTFPCQYASCTYESKRESNCRQHMERKHGWTYVRSKSAGKEDIFDERWAAVCFSPTLAPDASGSKAGSDMSISNVDTESSVGPSAWKEGRTTNDSAALASNAGDGTVQSQETTSPLVVEKLSDFTDSNTEQPGIIRRDAVEDQDSKHSKGNSPRHPKKLPFERAGFGRLQFSSSSGDSGADNAEDREFLRKQREAKRHKRMNDAQIGQRTTSEVFGSDSDMEDLGFSHARDPGPSARHLRRRTNPASKHPPPSVPELEKLDRSSDGGDGKSMRGRERSASAHRRAAAKEAAQRLDWLYPHAAHGTEDSNTSDLESIMSEAPSIASSRSSVPLNIDLGAIQELKTLLLTNEALIPLYDVAISKVGPEKFYRNFRRFLLRYGRALGSESTSSVQLKAARFVRSAASRVSMQIKENILNKDGKEQEKGKQNSKALEDYLKQTQDADDSSTEDSEHDPEEASLQTLESVKSFMLSSAAFSDLCHSLRVWLGVESQNKQPAPALTMIKLEVKESAAGEALTASRDPQPTPPREKIAKLGCGPAAKTASSLMLVELEEARAKGGQVSGEGAYNWVSVIRMTRKLVSNRLSGLWQASPPPGYVKVSWICVSFSTSTSFSPGHR
jgi:hypothetical protein